MPSFSKKIALLLGIWAGLVALHAPLLKLPYFWDEVGYFVPATLDFFRHGLLIPASTQPNGHTPLVMIYLGAIWHLAGFSTLATRSAMLLMAAATVVVTVTLASRVLGMRMEQVIWSAVLLALAPLFFAQSSMVHLDLAAALFTLMSVIALLEEHWVGFAVAASLAVLAKETAIVLVPVSMVFLWLEARRNKRGWRGRAWFLVMSPLAILAAWTVYYHHETGFWTGNAGYLQYNLYSTLNPVRILLCLLRRLQEVFIAGFSWILTAAAVVAYRIRRRSPGIGTKDRADSSSQDARAPRYATKRFFVLTALLTGAYLAMLSLVGGAILPRYTLPLYPPLIVLAMICIWRLPRAWARSCCVVAAAGLVVGWFSNPPYPVPFEDNLAYADFVRLHQQAAAFLFTASRPDEGSRLRILTAWPATNELTTPDLGYVMSPLRVTPIEGFTPADFDNVTARSYDLVYLYSRKWEPPGNWIARSAWARRIEARYFDYAPQLSPGEIEQRLHLKLLARWQRRGQWAAVYRTDELQ